MAKQTSKGNLPENKGASKTSSVLQSWDCNSLVWSIRDGLSSLSGEDRLSLEALKDADQPVNGDQLGVEVSTGSLYIKTDEEPTENSRKFIDSGQLWAYEEANPRGGSQLKFEFAGANEPGDRMYDNLMSFDGMAYALSVSGGGNTRLVYSTDGVTFNEAGPTGGTSFSGMDINPHTRTMILVATTTANNIRRSTDLGRTFDIITPPSVRSLNKVKLCWDTWVVACGHFSGSNTGALYSTDDGLTWQTSTVHEDISFVDLAFFNGKVFMVSNNVTGEEQLAVSTDFGANFTGKATPYGIWNRIIPFKGKLVITSSTQTGLHFRLAFSVDEGDTWETRLQLPAGTTVRGVRVYQRNLYMLTNQNYMIRTSDLENFDTIPLNVSTENARDIEFFEKDGSTIILISGSGGGNTIYTNLV